MKKANLFKILKIIFIIFILFILIIPKLGNKSFTFLEIVEFVTITLISFFGLFYELKKHAFSLNLMHWCFVLFFFVVAPVIQISFDFRPWGIIQTFENIEIMCFMIIVWCLFYYFGSIYNTKSDNLNNAFLFKNEISIKNYTLLFLTFLSIVCAIIIVKNVGLVNLFARSSSSMSFDGNYSKAISLITSGCTKAIIVYSVCVCMINYLKNKTNLLCFIVNVIILLITCFPTGLARNTAGIIYMGLFVVFYYNKMNKISYGMKYFILFIIGFIVIFPAINVFRNQDFNNVNLVQVIDETIDDINMNYLTEDYDAFSMIGNVRDYVNIYGIAYGKQFLGNLLFFIPRNIWKNKPVGTGCMIFSLNGFSFTNVSCPLLAECFFNFGILGISLVPFFISKFCAKVDKKYWYFIENKISHYSFIELVYPFLLPAYFFMLRGDFLSSFSNMSVYIFIFYVFSKIIKVKILI